MKVIKVPWDNNLGGAASRSESVGVTNQARRIEEVHSNDITVKRKLQGRWKGVERQSPKMKIRVGGQQKGKERNAISCAPNLIKGKCERRSTMWAASFD